MTGGKLIQLIRRSDKPNLGHLAVARAAVTGADILA